MNLAQYGQKVGVSPAAFQRKLEDEYGVSLSHETVRLWLLGRLQPAPKHIPVIEAATDGKVTRYDQRPDIYGPAPKKRRAV
jgi:DNA-binding transcriptional regulator YdaS (Cro superfamily)